VDHLSAARGVLERVAGHLKRIPKPGVETCVIEDAQTGWLLLVRVGWHAGKRVHNVVISARVRDGRVRIEEDNTDLSFADELARAGVPPADIDLAFHQPERAVAVA
jgi:XisI protein